MNDRFANQSRPIAGRRAWLGLIAVAGLLGAAPLLLRRVRGESSGPGLSLHARPRALPDLRFADGKGRALHLSDFRGRVVLLNVWATWCPPCRKEMPTLDHLQGTLGGPDFEVVALSIDRDGLALVQGFFKSFGIKNLRLYIDSFDEASASLVGAGVPLTLLIDRDGREIGRKLGPAVWDDAPTLQLIRGVMAVASKPAQAKTR